MTWQDQAECRHHDPEMFFTENARAIADARAVCRDCPVQAECFETWAAMPRLQRAFGVWAGMQPRRRETTSTTVCQVCGDGISQKATYCQPCLSLRRADQKRAHDRYKRVRRSV